MPPFVEWPITIKENKIIKIANVFPIKNIFGRPAETPQFLVPGQKLRGGS